MKREVNFKVNGEKYSVIVDTRETLLDALRYRLGFMGSKEGCGNGNCGSCTVDLNGATVNSCLVFAVEGDGAEQHRRCSVVFAPRASSCPPRRSWSTTRIPPRMRSVSPSPATCADAPGMTRSCERLWQRARLSLKLHRKERRCEWLLPRRTGI